MNLKELEYFLEVCNQKSINKAARNLYMTPQGLSRIMKNLEAELDTTLLKRSTGGIQLTDSGAYLYREAPDFLHTYYHMCNEIKCIEQREKHEIQLLSAYGILRLVTPDCIQAFQETYPYITFSYKEYPDHVVERHFLQGAGTTAFTIGNDSLRHVDAVKLESFEVKALVNKNHPLAEKEAVTLADMAEYPLYIENSEFHIHQMLMERFQAADLEPKIAFETSGFSLCHSLVAKGKGISVTVDFLADDMYHENLRLLPFADEKICWEPYMLTRKGEKPNPDLILFRDFVIEWMEKIKQHKIER